jgi:hypothetical protein
VGEKVPLALGEGKLMPASIVVDLSGLEAFASGWNANSLRAWKRAFQGEAFRLRGVTKEALSSGVGPPTAGLTRKQQRAVSAAAFSAMARFVAYEVVAESLESLEARIGWGRNARRSSKRLQQLEALVAGGGHFITRADQARIAYKIRRRLREPVQAPGAFGPWTKSFARRRSRYAAGKRRWTDISAWLPKSGSSLRWPRRNYVATLVAQEQARSVEHIRANYAKAIKGERF